MVDLRPVTSVPMETSHAPGTVVQAEPIESFRCDAVGPRTESMQYAARCNKYARFAVFKFISLVWRAGWSLGREDCGLPLGLRWVLLRRFMYCFRGLAESMWAFSIELYLGMFIMSDRLADLLQSKNAWFLRSVGSVGRRQLTPKVWLCVGSPGEQ